MEASFNMEVISVLGDVTLTSLAGEALMGVPLIGEPFTGEALMGVPLAGEPFTGDPL